MFLTMTTTIKINDDTLVERMKSWIDASDCDELARIAEEMFGGKIWYDVHNEEYEVKPNANYAGVFNDKAREQKLFWPGYFVCKGEDCSRQGYIFAYNKFLPDPICPACGGFVTETCAEAHYLQEQPALKELYENPLKEKTA